MLEDSIHGEKSAQPSMKPLKISCTMTNCAADLHYFKQTKKMRTAGAHPVCSECGADLVNWHEVWARDESKTNETFKNLKFECIRHYYWHREIDEKAVRYALKRGKLALIDSVEKRIRSSVGKAAGNYDGWQTKWEGQPIHYGQHATATCCRKCIEKWHGIPKNEDLTEDQIKYLSKLVILYILDRFSGLPDLPSPAGS